MTKHDENRKYACWIYSVPGIGNRTMDKLLKICSCEKEIYLEGEKLWSKVLNARQLEQIKDFARNFSPDEIYDNILEKKIKFVTKSDKEYPERLRDIPDPPYALYVKGKLPREDIPSVAVVGAREGSEYGSFVAAGIGKVLGEQGVQVISGMAKGIDGISQSAALEAGGISFGVLGCGVDICYPESNRKLYEKLCNEGGVLSEYPPGTGVKPGNFPLRNRIVSGLADVLIVVEARSKSGTLITVDMALEQGREVYVVPGRVTDRLSDGCNQLIRQGAGVFLSPEEFIREMQEGWRHRKADGMVKDERVKECETVFEMGVPKRLMELSSDHREVYGALDFHPRSLEQIGERLTNKYPIKQLMTIMMGLCMEKLVIQVSPGQFCIKMQE